MSTPASDLEVVVKPGHLAGPGDAEGALGHFLETSPAWGRHSPGQETTVALHESLLAAIELDHDTSTGPAGASPRTPRPSASGLGTRSFAPAHPSRS